MALKCSSTIYEVFLDIGHVEKRAHLQVLIIGENEEDVGSCSGDAGLERLLFCILSEDGVADPKKKEKET